MLLFFLTSMYLRFFNGMPEVFKPGVLNYYSLFGLILWILYESRNPTLTHRSLSGSMDTLLCDLIALTRGLAFFLSMIFTIAVASSFLSDRAYPYLNFLPSFFLSSLESCSDHVGINVSLKNSFSLFLLNV